MVMVMLVLMNMVMAGPLSKPRCAAAGALPPPRRVSCVESAGDSRESGNLNAELVEQLFTLALGWRSFYDSLLCVRCLPPRRPRNKH